MLDVETTEQRMKPGCRELTKFINDTVLRKIKHFRITGLNNMFGHIQQKRFSNLSDLS